MNALEFITKRIDTLQQRRDDQAAFASTLPAYDSRHDSAHAILATYEAELADAIEAREALAREREALADALRDIIAINDESDGACRKRMGTRRGNSIVTACAALRNIGGR